MKRLLGLLWLCILPVCINSAQPTPVQIVPIMVRWGCIVHPGIPAKPPKFTQNDIIGRSPEKVLALQRHVRNTVVGDYLFPGQDDCRQFIWIADKLLGNGKTFNVGGFSWGTYPDKHKPVQSLTVMGIPGKIFVSADQNFGTYTVTIR